MIFEWRYLIVSWIRGGKGRLGLEILGFISMYMIMEDMGVDVYLGRIRRGERGFSIVFL